MRKQIAALLAAAFLAVAPASQYAQTPADHHRPTVDVNATGKVLVPADQVVFLIHIEASAPTAARAFQQHKELEAKLVKILKSMSIDEKDISYELISLARLKSYNNQREEEYSQTRQSATVMLRDVKLYEKIQIALIDGGFDRFEARFTSSKAESARAEALKKAVETSKADAEVLAKAAGAAIGRAVTIGSSSYDVSPMPRMEFKAMMSAGADAADPLTTIPQTVAVTASVHIVWELK